MTNPSHTSPSARALSIDTGAVLLAFLLAALVRLGLIPSVPW
ncbi:MAG: hypothetical protein P4L36_03170 [Holophaga sp.]|nr:hypothetical protein [Holophaga sp.]